MKYIQFVNNLIKDKVCNVDDLILYGQNISAGSCLGGLTRDISVKNNSKIINTTNSENSLCGFGFGLMLSGTSSIFFMKQLDFLLLGIDHLVNTYNIIRNSDKLKLNGSFTIMPIVIDNGFQGPQSSLNNFADFCSIARITGYTITNKIDAEKIISSYLISPGFRIISTSQRLFQEEIIEPNELIYVNDEKTVFQYSQGNDFVIICFNFAFSYGYKLQEISLKKGLKPSLFNVNSPTPVNWDVIINKIKHSKKIVIIDDSKSQNLSCDKFLNDVYDECTLDKKIILKRNLSSNWLNPVDEKMDINYEEILDNLS